jgi:hypothetical protein
MKLKGKKIGFIMTGSYCTFKKTIEQLQKIILEKAQIIPVMSYNAYNLDTKYGKAKDFVDEIERLTRKTNNSYNSRSGSYWTKENDRHNHNCSSNRKYNCKTCS